MTALRMLLAIAAIATALSARCQTDTIKPLKKGELLPDITVDILLGDSVYKARMSDYKGNYLLLDFWSTGCVDCIAAMPDMLELNKKFIGKFKVLVVTKNSKEEVQELWRKFEKKSPSPAWLAAGKLLPFVVNDSILSAVLPHQGFPTHAWIDKDLAVYAKTYSTSTTIKNIEILLNKGTPALDDHGDVAINEKDPISWLMHKQNTGEAILYYSFITGYIEFGAGNYVSTILDD